MGKLLVFLYVKAILALAMSILFLSDPVVDFLSSKKKRKLNTVGDQTDEMSEKLKKNRQKNIILLIFGMLFSLGFIFFEMVPLATDTHLFFTKEIPVIKGRVIKFKYGKIQINHLYLKTDSDREIEVFVLLKHYEIGDNVEVEYFPGSKFGHVELNQK